MPLSSTPATSTADDSNTVRLPQVPTRVNSPSDVAFDSRDSAVAGDLVFSTSVLSNTFTANNSVQPGGIHPKPGQTTGGNGAITGQEVAFNIVFSHALLLPSDHYFFVPDRCHPTTTVEIGNGRSFQLFPTFSRRQQKR